MDIGDGREIQAATPDERADRLQELRADRQIAGHRAGLDHGRAFPILPHAFVVGDRRHQGDRGRGRGRIGAQAQVGAEHISVGVPGLHQRHQPARESGHEPPHGVPGRPLGINRGGGIVQQNEVHIRRIIQLARTQFAHAQDGEPTASGWIGAIRKAQFSGVMGGAQKMRHGQGQGRLGQAGQSRGDRVQWPQIADIGHRGCQRDNALGSAQRRGDPIARLGGRGGAKPFHLRGDDSIGPIGDQAAQGGGFADRQIGQIGAVAAEAAQQRQAGRTGRKTRFGSAQFGETLHQPVGGIRIVRHGPNVGQRESRSFHDAAGWP